ncbi:MAG: CDP-diacylglycerol--glycerol-3-phosphate 3-phosphatidyltransferase [Candidatus Babeliales bacterium]|nr:CDP-diacylglycerol--glycerol-3-phosphate 3-phosphatidyltransferase [Candidatus Babeliales bacterium]
MLNFNLPTTLTLIRLVLSPIILPLLFVYLLPFNNVVINALLGLLFIAFSLTDFFDGYLARKYRQETALGSILDPIADKFLVYSVLIGLAVVHKIYFFWVIIFIGREFFMMGLRQIALEHNFSVPVSMIGKFKTAFQMICLAVIIVNPYQSLAFGLHGKELFNTIELITLGLALGFTVASGYLYYRSFMIQFAKIHLGKGK